MGACLGKKSGKYTTKNRRCSSPKSLPTTKDDSQPINSSPTTPFTIDETDAIQISMIDEQVSLNSELQSLVNQQDLINQTMAQVFPTRIISVTESQLEYELANLVYGHPEQDYKDSAFLPATDIPS